MILHLVRDEINKEKEEIQNAIKRHQEIIDKATKPHNKNVTETLSINETTELTDEQIKILNEIGEKISIDNHNKKYNGVKGRMISLILGKNGKTFNLLVPENKDLLATLLNCNFLVEYIEKKGIEKKVIPSAIHYIFKDEILGQINGSPTFVMNGKGETYTTNENGEKIDRVYIDEILGQINGSPTFVMNGKGETYTTNENGEKIDRVYIDEVPQMKGSPTFATNRHGEMIDISYESALLTEGQKGIINEIIEKNLKIESNREYDGIKGRIISIDLENNGESFKVFESDDKISKGFTPFGDEIDIPYTKIISGNVDELKKYFEKKGIDKNLVSAAIIYLFKMSLHHFSYFSKGEDNKKIFNVDDSF